MEGRISWFLWSCGKKLRVPLKLRGGPGGPAHVSSGKSDLLSSFKGQIGIPLASLQGRKGPHLEFRQEPQSSSPFLTTISGFLWSLNRGVRPCLVFWHGTRLDAGVVNGMSGL